MSSGKSTHQAVVFITQHQTNGSNRSLLLNWPPALVLLSHKDSGLKQSSILFVILYPKLYPKGQVQVLIVRQEYGDTTRDTPEEKGANKERNVGAVMRIQWKDKCKTLSTF